jgi:hypothetical protein
VLQDLLDRLARQDNKVNREVLVALGTLEPKAQLVNLATWVPLVPQDRLEMLDRLVLLDQLDLRDFREFQDHQVPLGELVFLVLRVQ